MAGGEESEDIEQIEADADRAEATATGAADDQAAGARFDPSKLNLAKNTSKLVTGAFSLVAKRAGPWWEVSKDEADIFGEVFEQWLISWLADADIKPGKMVLFLGAMITVPRAAAHVAMYPKFRDAKRQAAADKNQAEAGDQGAES